MTIYKHPLVKILVFVLVLLTGVFLSISYKNTATSQPTSITKPTAPNIAPIAMQVIGNTPHDVTVLSPTGQLQLTMNVKNIGTQNTYTFVITDAQGTSPKQLFTKTVSAKSTMAIPPNTWSPDSKYIFLQQYDRGQASSFVLKTSGETFTNGLLYLTVEPLFQQQKPNYTITNITGWASETLLILYTKIGETTGPHFWFDVPSQSFIQLTK